MHKLSQLLLGLMICFGCSKKTIEMEAVQIECKSLRLTNASYSLITPCRSGSGNIVTTYEAEVKVNHNDKAICLDYIFVEANFKAENGSQVSGQLLKDRFKLTDPEVSYSDSEFRIRLTWNIDPGDASDFAFAEFEIHSENQLANESNTLYATVPVFCKETFLDADNNVKEYTVVGSIETTSPLTVINFYDFGSEDGDIIDVYLNGVRIYDNIMITKSGEDYTLSLSPGTNTLIVIAQNEGSVSPNTCGLKYGSESIHLTPNLNTGQAVEVILN